MLSGGEPAAMALIDACVRLLPGVIGARGDAGGGEFRGDCWNIRTTRGPPTGRAATVPEVLVSGHHEKVAAWRRRQAEEITRARRPDLWAALRRRRRTGAKKEDER